METAHLHLISNHVPVFALLFSLILFVLGELLKNKTLIVTALAGLIISAIASLIAFLSGEGAEKLFESISESEVFIEQHEELAKPASFVTIFLGLLAITGITIDIFKKSIPVFLRRMILLVSLVALVLISYTAYLGGQIRHTELRNTSVVTDPGLIHNAKEDD